MKFVIFKPQSKPATTSFASSLIRDGIVIYAGELGSLKRFKDDAKEVLAGFECGATISDKFDLQEGDVLEAYGQEELKNG